MALNRLMIWIIDVQKVDRPHSHSKIRLTIDITATSAPSIIKNPYGPKQYKTDPNPQPNRSMASPMVDESLFVVELDTDVPSTAAVKRIFSSLSEFILLRYEGVLLNAGSFLLLATLIDLTVASKRPMSSMGPTEAGV